jgi:uncharacterized protein (UPF0335 family)
MSASVADDLLRSFFDRWQRLEEEKRAVSDDLKELFIEAKSQGLDPKVMRTVFREQVGDRAALDEFDALCDLYRASLNGSRAGRAGTRTREIIDEFPSPVPRPQGGDGGRPGIPSTDARPGGEQGGQGPDIREGQSVHQSAGEAQARNEPGSVEPAPATRVKTIADYRPHCLSPSPSMCAASGLRHCHACAKAAGLAPSEAA